MTDKVITRADIRAYYDQLGEIDYYYDRDGCDLNPESTRMGLMAEWVFYMHTVQRKGVQTLDMLTLRRGPGPDPGWEFETHGHRIDIKANAFPDGGTFKDSADRQMVAPVKKPIRANIYVLVWLSDQTWENFRGKIAGWHWGHVFEAAPQKILRKGLPLSRYIYQRDLLSEGKLWFNLNPGWGLQ